MSRGLQLILKGRAGEDQAGLNHSQSPGASSRPGVKSQEHLHGHSDAASLSKYPTRRLVTIGEARSRSDILPKP
jgi:hypothetical protein